MKYLVTIGLLIVQATIIKTNRVKCPTNESKCFCSDNTKDLEFQCPPDYEEAGGFVMYYAENQKDLSLDCFPRFSETFYVDLLPNITIFKIDRLTIRYCPLPEKGFKDILNKLDVRDQVKYLRFENYAGNNNMTLNGDHFKGLDTLESLILEGNILLKFDENFLENTRFLTTIELPDNKINLTNFMFHKTTLLKSLDISRNQLKNLPDDVFRNLENLEILQLWQNNLTIINEFIFRDLVSLKTLSLDVNEIRNISDNAFKTLRNLTEINLSKNQLHTISPNTFKANSLLKSIIINHNFGINIPDYLFSNLTALTHIELVKCGLNKIPEHIFENSINLEIIFLNENLLKHIPSTLFKTLNKLKQIHLENNFLKSILSNSFKSLTKLKELYLHNNLIKIIERDAFTDLINLKVLTLQRNGIIQISSYTFGHLRSLKQIDLSHNKIDGHIKTLFTAVLLENNSDLEEVNLSHNRIISVEDVIKIHNKIHLKKLDLSHNLITNITLLDLQTVTMEGKLVVRLDNNNITKINFEGFKSDEDFENTVDVYSTNHPSSVIYLNNNPIECDCYNYDLVKYFRKEANPVLKKLFDIKADNLTCASPQELKELAVDKLSPQILMCSLYEMKRNYSGCPKECSCNWRPFDKSLVVDCSNRNLHNYPDFLLPADSVDFEQVELRLDGNKLTVGPDGNLSGYNNITKLFLSHNEIDSINWVPPKVEILKLDHNLIKNLDEKVLTMLNTSHLTNVTLNNNPWLCDCKAESLKIFLRQHTRQVDASNIFCYKSNNTLLIDQHLCQEWQVAILIVPVLALLLLIAMAAALYYRYQQELKIWLFAKNLCLWWVTEEDVDKDKVYDAFISYSHKDEDFVTQNLLPRLEGGPNPYKLCLHYRNWVPGEFIAKQVTTSVLESRRTLVVLSPNFLESVWGKLEFRTAHTQAMTEGRVRVIIVLYGDVDINSLDDELKAYLRTNTYIKWDDPHFWDRLIYALPHSKRNASSVNQKHANVMNCIDDKFKLVAPVTGSPGSTPPVLSLDPALLKHPLTFVPTAERDTPPAEAGTLLTSTSL